jgi:hypothetical protein
MTQAATPRAGAELLACCPFCGGPAGHLYRDGEDHVIGCMDRIADYPEFSGEHTWTDCWAAPRVVTKHFDQSVAAWNTRAALAAHPAPAADAEVEHTADDIGPSAECAHAGNGKPFDTARAAPEEVEQLALYLEEVGTKYGPLSQAAALLRRLDAERRELALEAHSYLSQLTELPPHDAVAAEREACAKAGYDAAKAYGCDVCCDGVAAKVNAAIRARSAAQREPATGGTEDA